MSKFRTVVDVQKYKYEITHQTPILMLGSCFTENIGNKLIDLKFSVNLNPFGIIFNPISILNSLKRIIAGNLFSKNELFFFNQTWHSFMHHSKYSSANEQSCLENINSNLLAASNHLLKSDYLILTFGTAWVFEHKADNIVVSNCHKIPASHFNRRILSVTEIVESYKLILEELKARNPNLKIIFTLSPVRHLKDGAEGNQISKSLQLPRSS